MNQKNPLVYAVIGAILGGLLVWYFATSAVNGNRFGMMQRMGFSSQNSTQKNVGTMSSAIDQHFIEEMTAHHEDAVTMANVALTKAEHQEIKTLAGNIKKTQTEEISQMKSWYKSWFGSDVPEDTDESASGRGMMGGTNQNFKHMGMMGDETDISTLDQASNFDKKFIEEMIPHHQMAVMMANMLLTGTNRPEMKELAQRIITAQTKETAQMRQWYETWGYSQ